MLKKSDSAGSRVEDMSIASCLLGKPSPEHSLHEQAQPELPEMPSLCKSLLCSFIFLCSQISGIWTKFAISSLLCLTSGFLDSALTTGYWSRNICYFGLFWIHFWIFWAIS